MCNKKFGQKQHLVSHIRSVHTDEKQTNIYPCQSCEKDFKTKGELKKHMNRVHLKLRPHECDICNSIFSEKGDLNKHIRSVHEKKTFPCPLCKIELSFKGLLPGSLGSRLET